MPLFWGTFSFSLWHHPQPFYLCFHSHLNYPDLMFSILSQGDTSFWFGYANCINIKYLIPSSPIKLCFVPQVGNDPNQKSVNISEFFSRTVFFYNAFTTVHLSYVTVNFQISLWLFKMQTGFWWYFKGQPCHHRSPLGADFILQFNFFWQIYHIRSAPGEVLLLWLDPFETAASLCGSTAFHLQKMNLKE